MSGEHRSLFGLAQVVNYQSRISAEGLLAGLKVRAGQIASRIIADKPFSGKDL
jgi:hypothetical protein